MGRQCICSLGLFSFSKEDSSRPLFQFDVGLRPVEGVLLNVLAALPGAGRNREWGTYSVWLPVTRYFQPGGSCRHFSPALSGTPHLAGNQHVVACLGVSGSIPSVDVLGVRTLAPLISAS